MDDKYLHQKIRRPAPPQLSHLTKAIPLPNTSPTVHVIEGTITSFTPADGRTPDLYTVRYDGGFTERLTVDEVEVGISYMEKRLSSCLSNSAIDKERERILYYDGVMNERHDLGMDIKVSHEIIWKLILVAAMEVEYEQRLSQQLQSLRSSSGSYSSDTRMRYYREHPTSYLGGQYVQTETAQAQTHGDEGIATFAPSTLAQRMRTGISKACKYYQSVFGDEVETRRSSRISSSSAPAIKPNPLEIGGAVALTLLQIFMDIDQKITTGAGGEIIQPDGNQMEAMEIHGETQDEEVNPHFEPTAYAIFNHLRANRCSSASDVQTAIMYAIEDSIPMTLPLMNLAEMSDDLNPDPSRKVTIECTTGDSLKDMSNYDPTIFAKCRFRIVVEHLEEEQNSEEVMDAMAAKEEFRRQEKIWRARKHFETWRHISVNGGKTIWPSWNDYVSEKLKSVRAAANQSSENGSAEEGKVEVKDEKIESIENGNLQGASDLAIAQAMAEPTTSRRSRRATRGDASDGPIFYGSNQSLTAQQVVETIDRLVIQTHPKGMMLLELKMLLMGEGDSTAHTAKTELKRVRVALGKLLFRLGKIHRMFVTARTDELCWEKLLRDGHGALFTVHLIMPAGEATSVHAINSGERNESASVEEVEPEVTASNEDVEDKKVSDGGDLDIQELEIETLQAYIQTLHLTELSLRSMLLKHNKLSRCDSCFQQVTPTILALSADERENDPDSYDSKFFFEEVTENGEGGGIRQDIEWTTSPSHPLIGRVIYRPSTVNGNKLLSVDATSLSCYWYKVVSYCPSLPIDESSDAPENVKDGIVTASGDKDSTVVERRIRFRAEALSNPNSNGTNGVHANHGSPSKDWVILTEAQVHAGIGAADLYNEINPKKVLSSQHPLLGMMGKDVLMCPTDVVANSGTVIHATIVGHEVVSSTNKDGVLFKVLVLPGEEEEGHSEEAFWADLSEDTSTITRLDPPTSYRLEAQEYHPSSPAYETCKTVLNYLKSNVKIMPFLEPVDPVALGIPDYLDIVKNPMDILTVEKKLAQGKYARIPAGGEFLSPVGKMLNGPFLDDVLRIFENAIMFNPNGDWIHNDAVTLKGLASRKIESLSMKAEQQAHGYHEASGGRGRTKTSSVYVDVDSDVDMYEYESDYDEDYAASTRRGGRKRSRAKATQPRLEDYSTRAIEKPITVPHQWESSLYSSLPISSDAQHFALPEEWTCRREKQHKEEDCVAQSEEQGDVEREKLLMLHAQISDQQTAYTRRSARSNAGQSTAASSTAGRQDTSIAIEGVEYILRGNNSIVDEAVESYAISAKDRSRVERVRETLHEELYAKLYYRYCSGSATILTAIESTIDAKESSLGTYTDGSFPPYLGRIIPNINSFTQEVEMKWEIRQDLIVPAIRWVLRGLVQSGHLVEWETSSLCSYEVEPILIPNHAYYHDASKTPFEILDGRRKKVQNAEIEEEEEVELSAYEKMRLERVARNKERLKALGLG